MWTYKNIDIQVDDTGLFEYCFQNKYYREDTLEKAKRSIEENTRSYYKITEQDYKNLLAKLNNRERHFISSIIQELESHANSAYCEQGLNLDFEFNLKD